MPDEWRNLTADEARLIKALVGVAALDFALDQAQVSAMDDGGMGSLEFQQSAPSINYSRWVAELMFHDSDGVPVFAMLSVNAADELQELDMFKGDFSPLVRIADTFDPFPPITE